MGLDFLQLINPVWAEKGGASTEERQKETEGVRTDIGGPGWDMMRTGIEILDSSCSQY